MPLTFRLIFHGVRSVSVASLIALIAWLVFVPASPTEQAALARGPLGDQRHGLAQLRFARTMLHFAPERAARTMSRATDGEISPELAGLLLRQMAGQAPATAPFATGPAPQPESAQDGAKFIRVPQTPPSGSANE
ncbi:hypothetical protein ACJ5NV_00310 [Loktanella agnita]|uniref:hypothetical protein n=1 Tax=Loktanella agnita TaxID=287097 RepID=UPI00398619B5